jgi:VWFA-related protein
MRAFVVCLVLAAPIYAAEPGIQFSTPRRQATIVGPSKAQVEVVPPAGATVVRVGFFVDGAAAGSKAAPPFSFEWDAGDGALAHRLDAVATFSDGTEARATVTTSRLTINATEEVALVNLYAIAKGPKGAYVNDLQQSDFRIFENGNPQAIERFSAERRPLRIAIVLDTSLSMEGDKLKSAIDSAVAFLDILQSGDEGLVVTFSDEAAVRRDLTSNRGELESAIRSVQARGGTSLYDAIFKASQRLAEFDGRRVLLLLSDGRDEAASGLEPGSLHTLQEARDRALRDEVMVFAIGLGKEVARDAKALEENPTARATALDFYGRQALVTILRSLAETTGGTAVFAPGAGQLRKSFDQVAEDLRHQYALAYTSDDPKHDGAWREIKVQVLRPGVAVTNRKGYYAPSDIPVRRSNTKLRP